MRSEKKFMNKTFIIAEAGVNHNGQIDIAKELIVKAKDAGADAVKFQTFKAANIVCKTAQKAQYQVDNTLKNESQSDMLKKLELDEEAHAILMEYSKQQDILFLSTPFDLESICLLEKLQMPLYKIPSGEVTNYPYLLKIGQTKKPVIISTGMCTIEEIEETIRVLRDYGTKIISLLHCNTEYPTPMEDVNLRAIQALQKRFHLPVGYSDHTEGIEISIAAVAMGATIIEKHFTLDNTMEGPDHKASLEPGELSKMVRAIRNIEQALGNGIKQPTISEQKNIPIVRKSIVAKENILKGSILTEENLTTKRPGNGISPMKWNEVIGTVALQDFEEDAMIKIEKNTVGLNYQYRKRE